MKITVVLVVSLEIPNQISGKGTEVAPFVESDIVVVEKTDVVSVVESDIVVVVKNDVVLVQLNFVVFVKTAVVSDGGLDIVVETGDVILVEVVIVVVVNSGQVAEFGRLEQNRPDSEINKDMPAEFAGFLHVKLTEAGERYYFRKLKNSIKITIAHKRVLQDK